MPRAKLTGRRLRKDRENRKKFGAMYMTWFDKIFENSKNLTAYVVKLDWLPEKEEG